MAAYYKDDGSDLKGKELKKYLAALKKAEQTGQPYTGKTYYTRQQLETKYNGFDLGAIRKAGKLRYMLLEAPAAYKTLSDQELQAQADAQYASEAETQKNAANSLYATNKQTLEQQRASLDQPYQQQVQTAQNQTAQNVDSLTGSMISRGLGRSSYAGAMQNNAQQAGTSTVNNIMAEKGQKVNDINSQIGTLGSNLNTALSTIDSNKGSAVKSAFDTLKANNFTNAQSTADARTTFLFNLLQQVSKKKVTSSGRSTSTSSGSSSGGQQTSSSGNALTNITDWINGLLGG